MEPLPHPPRWLLLAAVGVPVALLLALNFSGQLTPNPAPPHLTDARRVHGFERPELTTEAAHLYAIAVELDQQGSHRNAAVCRAEALRLANEIADRIRQEQDP